MPLIWPKGTKVKKGVEIDGWLTFTNTVNYKLHEITTYFEVKILAGLLW